jgi:UDP-GlcNAc:undecaprenyl-phosphate GlcNAc-1-phosphate transferase
MIYLSTLFMSTLITVALIAVLKRYAAVLGIVDTPNNRKVHDCPIPKVGGLGMAVGVFLPIFLWLPVDHFLKDRKSVV